MLFSNDEVEDDEYNIVYPTAAPSNASFLKTQ